MTAPLNGHASPVAAAPVSTVRKKRKPRAYAEAEPREDIHALGVGTHEWECREGGSEPAKMVIAATWFDARAEAARIFQTDIGRVEVRRK